MLSKGFLQREVLGEVSVLEGGQFGAKFFAKFGGEVFHEVFGFVSLGHSEQKNFCKNVSPKFQWLCTAKLKKFQGKTSWRGSARGPSSAGPKRGCINVGAWNPQESGRKAPLSCNAAFSMLQCSFSFAAAQLSVQMTSALQKRQCCSAVPAAQRSENCSATSVFACGMLQGWGLEGSGLGLADLANIMHTPPSTLRASLLLTDVLGE